MTAQTPSDSAPDRHRSASGRRPAGPAAPEPAGTALGGAPISELVERARAEALENVFDAIVVTDLDGRIVYWNPGSERLYGYTADEILGRPVNILHVPEESDHLTAEVLRHVERDGRWQGEVGLVRKDGSRGWIESSVVPIFDADGHPVGALGINRDISSRIEADRARSKLFADISHELRTPLTLTLGPLDDLLQDPGPDLPDDTRQQVELARRNAARVLELTRQILELAQLEAGVLPLQARPVDLGPFLEGVAGLFAPGTARRSIRLDVRAPDGPIPVHADPQQLETVFSTLLSNALRATPEGGTVRLSTHVDEERVRVHVRDSGPGIRTRDLPAIFDRFHHGVRPTGEAGASVRLSLAKELTELHGGTLTVESDEGFGSTFTVTLRRGAGHLRPDQLATADPGPAAHPVPTDAAADAGPLPQPRARPGPTAPEEAGADPTDEDVTTVLVVEDDPEIRSYLRGHLERGYRVLEAADGDRGWELARDALPDLVLADVTMPGLDGYALCRTIKSSPATDFIPVVLLTARAAPGDRLAGLREAADDYLTKPFRATELLARIENLIASRKRLRERFSGPALVLRAESVDVESADARFLEQVRSAIEENLHDEDYSVERLARDVAHSRGHLHRRLRALLDEAPSDLLRRMRLERAAHLIEAGAGTIGSIAYSVGFKSIAHFSNRFRDHFGVRPSAYPPDRAG